MQLNFLTGYDNETVLTEEKEQQSVFWDLSFNIIKPPPRKPRYRNVEKFFAELDYKKVPEYKDYWEDITPTDDSQLFKRWLFAFMSVHTSWKANVAGYQAIENWWKWINRWEDLKQLIEDSRVGMQNNRAKYLSEFAHKFWENPSRYKKKEDEAWSTFRNKLKIDTLGLGPAKTSFALEMCYPNSAKLSCLDTHMFQAYGLDQTKDAKMYGDIETHWVDMCSMWNVPPYIARCLYWDEKQGHRDSRYWSYVFEKQK